MLFLLTGEVQIGKTRWLESLVTELADRGVPCAGVLAPGQWVPSEGEHADANGFEKLGIDNVLLPSGERIPFARRGDLARADGTFNEESQAAKAELAWHIDDAAIDRVNAHFDELAVRASVAVPTDAKSHSGRSAEGAESKDPSRAPGLLIVDELGRLEIWRGGGLTSAMALLAQGPTAVFPHALAVVRDYLLDDAEILLAEAWPDHCRISPDDTGRAVILSACEFGA
ncbi:hypothetical protein [Adlercreutzia equolifaciens]|uniref:hypothetical protein n=1 Tax=Adlercreutzia equolifaciens TaxID=446660 RepID=UPI002430BC96|nr:hypothetical protein [Adlercreutzia equolifaciens]